MLNASLTEYAIKGLESELAVLDTKRNHLLEQLQALRGGRRINGRAATPRSTTTTTTKRRRPVISEEGRRRIAEAQRARWAKSKAANESKKPGKTTRKVATKAEAAAARERRIAGLAEARRAKAAKKAAAAAPAPAEREIARPPMPRHVKKNAPPQQPQA